MQMACPNTDECISDVDSIGYDRRQLVDVCQFGSCLPQYQSRTASTLLPEDSLQARPAEESTDRCMQPAPAVLVSRVVVSSQKTEGTLGCEYRVCLSYVLFNCSELTANSC